MTLSIALVVVLFLALLLVIRVGDPWSIGVVILVLVFLILAGTHFPVHGPLIHG